MDWIKNMVDTNDYSINNKINGPNVITRFYDK